MLLSAIQQSESAICSTTEHILQENHNSKDTCTLMCIAALSAIASTWKQPKCPLTDERIKKMWSIYAME